MGGKANARVREIMAGRRWQAKMGKDLVYSFNDISTFVGYLMTNLSL